MDRTAPVSHPVHELIAKRFSPRIFSSRALDDATLASLFEAARWAPSSFNEQPWSFVIAKREDQAGFERLLDCLVPGNQTWAHTAAVLAISVAHLNFIRTGKANRHALHDVGLASATLALQATALGLGIHMMSGFDVEKSRAVLHIPQGFEPAAAIAFGYAEEKESLPEAERERLKNPRTRKPLSDFVFEGKWGSKAAGLP